MSEHVLSKMWKVCYIHPTLSGPERRKTMAQTVVHGEVRPEQIDGGVAAALLESSPECVKLLDPEGRLRYMSGNGRTLMEIDDFSIVDGRHWWDLWPEGAESTLRNAVASAGLGVATTFDAACPTAGGTEKQWRVRVRRVDGGDLDGMILASSQDISEEVDRERALAESSAEVDSLRRFGHLLAHDLRNPIRHVRLLAQRLQRRTTGAEVELEMLSDLVEQSGVALALLDSLAKLQIEGIAEQEPVSLHGLIASALEVLGPDAPEVRCDGRRVSVVGNHALLVAAFRNILENSVKYAKPGVPPVVELTVGRNEAGFVQIDVADNGRGFDDDEETGDVFGARVRQSNATGVAGSGLGLTLVELIVRHHGGAVSAHRSTDGAVVRVELREAVA